MLLRIVMQLDREFVPLLPRHSGDYFELTYMMLRIIILLFLSGHVAAVEDG